MAILFSDIVLQIKRDVLSDLREEVNYLGANILAGATTISLTAGSTLGGIQAGALLEIDQEVFRVTGTPTSISSIPVQPGYQDTTQAGHSSGAEIAVNPRFPQAAIMDAINKELDDLSAPTNGLFQMLEITTTFIPVRQGYDLTGLTNNNVLEIWEVRAHEYGPSEKWPPIPGSKVQLQRNADTSVFPSGMAMTLDKGGYPGRPLRVQYKSPYITPMATTNLVTDSGLHPQANDILNLGAPARLMQYRELKRSFSEAQGEPRRAQEVPVGASLTAAKGLMQLRQDRIAAERSRLEKMYPRYMR